MRAVLGQGTSWCAHAAIVRPQRGRGRKNSCANRRNRACATRNPTPSAKVFFSRRSTRKETFRVVADAGRAVAILAGADCARKKTRVFPMFFYMHFPRARMRPLPADGGWQPGASRWTFDCAPPREKSCTKLLTPRKSVIRFRPKQSILRKRVSRIDTTARETTRPTVRTGIAVDAGFASPGKTHRPLSRAPVSPRDAGVFVFVGSRVSHARAPGESASPRWSRRRLPAGPTPAAFLATGPAHGQMCCNQMYQSIVH